MIKINPNTNQPNPITTPPKEAKATQQKGLLATFKNVFCGLFSAMNPANWGIFSHVKKDLTEFKVQPPPKKPLLKQLSEEAVQKRLSPNKPLLYPSLSKPSTVNQAEDVKTLKVETNEKDKKINDQAKIIEVKDKQIQELMEQIELLKKQSLGSNLEAQSAQNKVVPPEENIQPDDIPTPPIPPPVEDMQKKSLAEFGKVQSAAKAKVGNKPNLGLGVMNELLQKVAQRSANVNFNPQLNKPKNVGEKEIPQEDLAKQKLEKFLGNPIAKQAALMSLAENQSDKKSLLTDLFKDIEKAVAEKKDEKLTKELAKIKDNIGQDAKIELEEENVVMFQAMKMRRKDIDDDSDIKVKKSKKDDDIDIENKDIKPEKLQEFYAKSFNEAKVMSLKSDVNSLINFLERNKINYDQK